MTAEYVGEGGLADICNRTMKRSGRVTLGVDGVATIAFDPPIIMAQRPRIVLTPHVVNDGDGLIGANVIAGSYTQDAEGKWTGCQIIAARVTKKLPIVTLASELSGLKITDRDDVTGEEVDWMAF